MLPKLSSPFNSANASSSINDFINRLTPETPDPPHTFTASAPPSPPRQPPRTPRTGSATSPRGASADEGAASVTDGNSSENTKRAIQTKVKPLIVRPAPMNDDVPRDINLFPSGQLTMRSVDRVDSLCAGDADRHP